MLLADFTAAALILKTDVVDVLEDHICLLHDGLCLCAICRQLASDIKLRTTHLVALVLAHLQQVVHAEEC